MAGWNFFLYEAILIPFEISALNVVLTFWSDNIPLAAICAACIVAYAIINVFGFENIAWLQTEWGIKIAISCLTTWAFVGYNALLILAALGRHPHPRRRTRDHRQPIPAPRNRKSTSPLPAMIQPPWASIG